MLTYAGRYAGAGGRPWPRKKVGIDDLQAYINRELSWLHFARRVLALAEDEATPLLERVKFAGIMGMLYDEVSMKGWTACAAASSRKTRACRPMAAC